MTPEIINKHTNTGDTAPVNLAGDNPAAQNAAHASLEDAPLEVPAEVTNAGAAQIVAPVSAGAPSATQVAVAPHFSFFGHLVPLLPVIVACALFMENMDSTVIATSLPV